MRQERADRGRHDHGERSADREVHPHRVVDAERPEQLVQRRQQDAAAADPEQPGEQSGDRAREQQGAYHQRELTPGHSRIHGASALSVRRRSPCLSERGRPRLVRGRSAAA
jgi:hypothetical protein